MGRILQDSAVCGTFCKFHVNSLCTPTRHIRPPFIVEQKARIRQGIYIGDINTMGLDYPDAMEVGDLNFDEFRGPSCRYFDDKWNTRYSFYFVKNHQAVYSIENYISRGFPKLPVKLFLDSRDSRAFLNIQTD